MRDTSRKNLKFISHARRINSTATPPLHVAYPQQGNQAGDSGSEMAVGTRLPVQTQRQKRARQVGHRHAQIQNGDLRQRLFLAWTRGMQAVCFAENQHGFLEGQDRKEPNQGYKELRRTDARRLASHRHLAMQSGQRQT